MYNDLATITDNTFESIVLEYFDFKSILKKLYNLGCRNLLVEGGNELSKNILKSYGLCPYLDLDLNNLESIDKDLLDKNRLSWLQEQSDNGSLFFDLYDDLIDKKNLIELRKTKLQYETDINDLLKQSSQFLLKWYFGKFLPQVSLRKISKLCISHTKC